MVDFHRVCMKNPKNSKLVLIKSIMLLYSYIYQNSFLNYKLLVFLSGTATYVSLLKQQLKWYYSRFPLQ